MKAVQRVANIGGFVGCLLGGDEGKGRELAALWAVCIEGTSRRLGSWDSRWLSFHWVGSSAVSVAALSGDIQKSPCRLRSWLSTCLTAWIT